MNRDYHRRYSPILERDMEMLVFGHAGAPVLVFPTSMGRFYQFEDFNMVETLSHHIEQGWIQLYCVDGIDTESLYNWQAPPEQRIHRHNLYDRYIAEEVVPFIREQNPVEYLITTGCSFGGYHSINFALRHPELVNRVIGISGYYELGRFMRGFSNDEVYYHSPIWYMQHMHDPHLLHLYRTQLEIIIVVGEHDIVVDSSRALSDALAANAIPHTLDIWTGAWHDWPWWKQMILKYI